MASVLGVTDAEPTEAAVETAARRVMADVGAMKSAMSVMAEAAKADDKTPGGIAKASSPLPRVPSIPTSPNTFPWRRSTP